MEGTVLIQSCSLVFYMKNKNIDRFLKADPNVEPQLPGLAYQTAPPTEVHKFPNSVFTGFVLIICLCEMPIILLAFSTVDRT